MLKLYSRVGTARSQPNRREMANRAAIAYVLNNRTAVRQYNQTCVSHDFLCAPGSIRLLPKRRVGGITFVIPPVFLLLDTDAVVADAAGSPACSRSTVRPHGKMATKPA